MEYRIDLEKHVLEGAAVSASPDHGGPITPKFIVIHYTAGGAASGSIDWLSRADDVFVSAHVVIDRDGAITQLVPFNLRAFHAGKSAWKTQSDLNRCSVGIELANHGLCVPRANGALATASGVEIPRERGVQRAQRPGGPLMWWERFPDAQFDACSGLCAALKIAYPILEIVGHNDIAPGRKIDPGPAFDMGELRRRVGLMDA